MSFWEMRLLIQIKVKFATQATKRSFKNKPYAIHYSKLSV